MTAAVSDASSKLKPQGAGNKSVSARDFSIVIALLCIWGFFAFAAPSFLSSRNLSNLAVELSITAILSLGAMLVIVAGEIDLLIGSGVGLLGGLAAVLIFNASWPAPRVFSRSCKTGDRKFRMESILIAEYSPISGYL